MGLDLMLYRKKDYEKEMVEGNVEELAYGRKTWSIWYWFKNREDSTILDDYTIFITKDSYMAFCETLLPYEPYLKHIASTPSELITELDYKTAEYIYRQISDDSPALGYDWDCAAFYRWMEVLPEVMEVDDDYLVLYASY